jgi:acyl-CoA synthetase (AMP-forming)/AMP-acid ligase II
MAITLFLDVAQSLDGDRLALGRRADKITTTRLTELSAGGASIVVGLQAKTLVFVGVNGPAFPVALFASGRAGVPIAPLNYRLPADAILELIARLDLPVIVADTAFADSLRALGRPVLTTDEWMDGCARAQPYEGGEIDDADPAVLLFTSGTTAEPKCVVLRHENLQSYVLGTIEPGSCGADEAALVSVPPYHIAGIGTVLTNIFSGRRLLYLPTFTAAAWLDLVRSEDVTFAMVVPTMLARIVASIGDGPAQLPSLRTIAYGGARMPQPVLERALDLLPGVGFVNAYGLTETSSTIALLGPQDHVAAATSEDPAVRARLGSVGRIIAGIEGEIRDGSGQAVPIGEVGELWVRGGQVSGEYAGIGSVLDDRGWFPTRDHARMDGDGYLFITGRTDDVVIRGGENISPAEIEDVLLRHPSVAEAAVVGVPDEEWGERLGAVVVLAADGRADVDELRTWVRERLRSSKTPDLIVFRDELPHTDTGKLLRRVLVSDFVASNTPARPGD